MKYSLSRIVFKAADVPPELSDCLSPHAVENVMFAGLWRSSARSGGSCGMTAFCGSIWAIVMRTLETSAMVMARIETYELRNSMADQLILIRGERLGTFQASSPKT